MKNTNYEDYEQMSTEIINSKYNNIGSTKRSKFFFTKKKIIFMVISLAVIVLILYLIFRPKKKSTENTQITENEGSNDLEKEYASLIKKEEELQSENNKLKTQKESLQKENDNIDKQIKELNEKNKKNEDNKKNGEKEVEEKKEKVKEYENKVKEIKDKIEQLNKKGKELKDKNEENSKEIKSIESKIEELEKELNIEKKDENKNEKKEEEKKEEKKDEEKKDDNKKDDDKDKKDNDQKKEEPQPSNPEVTKRIDSKIINELKHLELLDKWFEHKLNYKLLYRATEEQYSASIFHQKVDSYKNTIIFIKDINNFIYGGFTTKTWDGNKSYKSDKNAILFNLDKEKYYDVNDYSHAILCDKDLLAVFGDGDLILGPKSIESAFPKSFGNKDVKDNELTMGYNKLSPVEMEVFQLSY